MCSENLCTSMCSENMCIFAENLCKCSEYLCMLSENLYAFDRPAGGPGPGRQKKNTILGGVGGFRASKVDTCARIDWIHLKQSRSSF